MKKKSSLIVAIIVLIALLVLLSLGFWQLKRASQKEMLLVQRSIASQQQPLTNQTILTTKPSENLQFYPVKLTGTFDNTHPILLDNTIKNGQVGYQLFLPLNLNRSTVILVAREFIPAPTSRAQLPVIEPQTGEVTIEGYLDFAYRNPFISKAIESTQIQWPLRVQQIDCDRLGIILGKNTIPMLVKSKLAMEFPVSPQRHRAYACQWFGLAIALLVVYFFFMREKEPL